MEGTAACCACVSACSLLAGRLLTHWQLGWSAGRLPEEKTGLTHQLRDRLAGSFSVPRHGGERKHDPAHSRHAFGLCASGRSMFVFQKNGLGEAETLIWVFKFSSLKDDRSGVKISAGDGPNHSPASQQDGVGPTAPSRRRESAEMHRGKCSTNL